jgi:phenylalanyl-tRNA synthetase alpha chain
MALSTTAKKLLLYLSKKPAGSTIKKVFLDNAFDLANEDSIRVAAEELVSEGLIQTKNEVDITLSYTDEGRQLQKKGLYEVQLLQLVYRSAIKISDIDADLRRFAISAAKKAGWIKVESGVLKITDVGKSTYENKNYPILVDESRLSTDSFLDGILDSLIHRGLIEKKTRVSDTSLKITARGESYAQQIDSNSLRESFISEIDRKMLLEKSWIDRPFKPYAVDKKVKSALLARRHPISRLRDKVKHIFLSMGFEQMGGPLCDSSFWVFDALFQPQDHPARDLADTFYIDKKGNISDQDLINRVSKSHQLGWDYQWDLEESKKMVLRTHTTAVSAKTLYDTKTNPAPRKFFSIGKVFRNEATDYKHLAEFFQVEGIISWEGANFSHLLGTLKEFYSKLGFEQIRFRPSYFPYTEPSLEIEVFHPNKKEWMELGGAGIFRPEVTISLCGKYPVLAWGLSLERPLMLASKTDDIRTLYRNDLGWLRDFSID